MAADSERYVDAFDEVTSLRARLEEAEETLRAIRSGEVDALVVAGPDGNRVFSLEGAETPYRVLVEQMNEGAVTLSADGVVLYANRRFAEFVGVPADQAIGAAFASFFDPGDRATLGRVAETARSVASAAEVTALSADGSRVPLRLALSLLPNTDGSLCVVASDMTETRERGEALQRAHDELDLRVNERTAELAAVVDELYESEARTRATLYAIGDAFLATDHLGRVTQMNPVAEKLVGWSEGEARGRPVDEVFRIVNEDTRETVASPVRRVLEEDRVVGLANHTLLISRDGVERPIADSGAPVRDERGQILGVVLVFRDQSAERADRYALEQSRQLLQTVVDSSPSPIYLLDTDGTFLLANKAIERVLGASRGELVGRTRAHFLPPEVADSQRAADLRVIASRESIVTEEQVVDGSGTRTYVSTRFPVLDADGHVEAVGGTSIDVTERKRSAQMLAQLDRGLRVLNEAALALAAGEPGPELYADLARKLKSLTGGSSATLGLYDPNDRCVHVQHAELDPGIVTDLIQALGGKRLTETPFHVPDEVYASMREHPIQYQRSLSEATFGVVPRLTGAIAQKLQRIDRFLGIAYFLDGELYGTSLVALHREMPDPPADLIESFAQIVSVALRRIRAEEALQAERDKLRTFLNAAPVAIVISDEHERVQQINPAAERLFGRSAAEARALRCGDLVGCVNRGTDPRGCGHGARCPRCGLYDAIKEALAGRLVHDGEFELDTRIDGTNRVRQLMVNAEPLVVGAERGAVLAIHDITELRHAQRERESLQTSLAQSDRLASMGMLAAGVAHEINNPLAYVLYNLESLSGELPKLTGLMRKCHQELTVRAGEAVMAQVLGDDQRVFNPAVFDDAIERLREAQSGAQRIKGIARSLGTFSRVEQVEVTPVNLQVAIEHASTMAHNEIKFRARMVKDFSPVPAVLASEGKLAQVFLNLFINAAHAIDEGHVEDNEIRATTWSDGDYVYADVSDTGKGIAPEHREKVFEPFYSTKGVGAGSGLGLSICRSIVIEFGGDISLIDTKGVGTRFRIRLPRMPDDWGRRESPRPPGPGATALPGRILVVDDEPAVRAIIERMLGREHEIVVASSGLEAKALLEHDQRFDIIFCDLMMPEMSGMDLHAWIAAQHPKLAAQVVFVTGGAFTPGAAEYLAKVGNMRVDKPFDAAAFKALTAELLIAAGAKRDR